jgi:hypothetical protein
MDSTERSQFVRSYTKVLTNAWSDESFEQRLKQDPKAVLSEYELGVPDSATVKVIGEKRGEGDLDEQVRLWEHGRESGTYELYVPDVPQLEGPEMETLMVDPPGGPGLPSGHGGHGGNTYCCCCCPCCTCT